MLLLLSVLVLVLVPVLVLLLLLVLVPSLKRCAALQTQITELRCSQNSD